MARTHRRQRGMTMIELLVALSIGSFLIIGAVQVYNQSRQAFVINESIARVQETAQFALDTLEADLRVASNFGRHSRGTAIEGRSIGGVANPNGLPVPVACGAGWALDLARPVMGQNNAYNLLCPAQGGAQGNSDTLTLRRVSIAPTPPAAGTLQVQSTRTQGELFANGAVPPAFSPATSATHDLVVNSYYVSASSALIPGVPTLRRKTLTSVAGNPVIVDQEVAPGVENLQLQFGVDINDDNTVDRYVNPGAPILTPGDPAFIPLARIITARVWLIVRSVSAETGLNDQRNYRPGDVVLGVPADDFRRLQVSKTILLRNARS